MYSPGAIRRPTEGYLRVVRQILAVVDPEDRDVVMATALMNAPCDNSPQLVEQMMVEVIREVL